MFKSSKKEEDSYSCTLSPEMQEKAAKELNEDPKTRLLEVKNLRTRLEKVPGLQPRTDVKFLLRFLRARKFDQERTFQLVKNYYDIRLQFPDICNDLKPSRIRHVFDDGFIEVLKHRDKEGCRVVIFRPGDWDPDCYPADDLFKAVYVILSRISEEEDTQVSGVHLIGMLGAISLKQVTQVTPTMARYFVSTIQDVVPMRLKRYDFVNEPAIWDIFFTMVKPFMKAKLLSRKPKVKATLGAVQSDFSESGSVAEEQRRRLMIPTYYYMPGFDLQKGEVATRWSLQTIIIMNGDKFDQLHASIQAEFLPTDLGGQLPPYSYKEFIDDLLASDAKFEEDNKFGFVKMNVDSGTSVSRSGDADMQGLGGTFKKLEI